MPRTGEPEVERRPAETTTSQTEAAEPTETTADPNAPRVRPDEWKPTENPNATVKPGRMRSDREEIPGGFTKEEADRAETMEAAKLQSRTTSLTAGCQVYWPSPWEVCGAIKDKYNSLGGPNSFLLWPAEAEIRNGDGVGYRQRFVNGPIYWHPQAGAHPVVNHFFAAWQRNGWEGGVLKYPTTDEIPSANGGRRQEFQGGTIYWKLNEAYYVTGAIRDKWRAAGGEAGWMGYPQSDQIRLPDGIGYMNRFENNSVIYWSPTTAAHPVAGGILDQWSQAGYERSSYGYPTQDEVSHAGIARSQEFQHGTVFFPKRAAAESIHSDFLNSPGQSQCEIPQAQRVGAWTCLGPPVETALASPDEQQRRGFSEFCEGDLGGCWRVYDDFKADYAVQLFFGTSSRFLGTGQAVVTWQLAGTHTDITTAWIKSNDLVIKTAWFSGALFNGAVGAEGGGSLIHATQKVSVNGPFNVDSAVRPPNLGVFKLVDGIAWDHNYAFQISVEFDLEEDIPGYWYFWVRSPVSHDNDDDEDVIYRFSTADALPGSSHDSGWSW